MRAKGQSRVFVMNVAGLDAMTEKNAMKLSAVKILGRIYLNIYAVLPVLTKVIDFPKQ